MRICVDLTEVILTPLKFILDLKESQDQHEIYLHDEFKVSLFMIG